MGYDKTSRLYSCKVRILINIPCEGEQFRRKIAQWESPKKSETLHF